MTNCLFLLLSTLLGGAAPESTLITHQDLVSSHVIQQKVVDDGGTGPYKSVVVTDKL